MNNCLKNFIFPRVVCTAVALLLISSASNALAKKKSTEMSFAPIATFDVMAGNGSIVAEIVDVDNSGKELIYTDSESKEIGFVNNDSIRSPRR